MNKNFLFSSILEVIRKTSKIMWHVFYLILLEKQNKQTKKRARAQDREEKGRKKEKKK